MHIYIKNSLFHNNNYAINAISYYEIATGGAIVEDRNTIIKGCTFMNNSVNGSKYAIQICIRII